MICICNEEDLYETIRCGHSHALPSLIEKQQSCKCASHDHPMRVKHQLQALLHMKDFATLAICIDTHFLTVSEFLDLQIGDSEDLSYVEPLCQRQPEEVKLYMKTLLEHDNHDQYDILEPYFLKQTNADKQASIPVVSSSTHLE